MVGILKEAVSILIYFRGEAIFLKTTLVQRGGLFIAIDGKGFTSSYISPRYF
jgi:hypothetical protein